MELIVDEHPGRVPVTVLHISGNIDSSTHQDFETQAKAALEAGARYVLLDLKRVEFMSSAGLHSIHNLFSLLRTKFPDASEAEMQAGISAGTYKSAHLKLARPSGNVRKVLEMGGFDMYLEIHEDVDAAVASF